MAKRKSSKKAANISKKSQRLVLGGVIVASLGILAFMVFLLPTRNTQPVGIGADGFSAFVRNDSDLGVKDIVSKDAVEKAVGSDVKSVSDVEVSKVFDLNGTLGQTAEFPVVLKDGSKGSVTVDYWKYKDASSVNENGVLAGTGVAGKVNDREVRYQPAISLGKERHYTLVTANGAEVYRFIFVQPSDKVQVKEYRAQDILKAIIAKSNI